MRLVGTTDQQGNEPYRDAAGVYWSAGWHGVIPLPPRAKALPPTGFTGSGGVFPSRADVQAWIDGPEGRGNVALRLPHHILGVDVDVYSDKHGDRTLTAAVNRWGPLPVTWRSTSREDSTSGIYLYRIPDGLTWPGELGPDVELIQYRHRYAVVWPSVHPEGRTYRWVTPDGLISTVPPHPDQLPVLPDPWITGLTHGRVFEETPRNTLPAGSAGLWLAARDATPGRDGCPRTTHALHTALTDLAGPGSAHETTRGHVMRLVRLASQGHPGGVRALQQLRQAFLLEVTRPGRDGHRDDSTAEHEWQSLLVGAVNIVTAEPACPAERPPDPCDNPFAGLLPSPERPVATGTTALQPPPATTPAAAEEPAAAVVEHTSWWPKDLDAVLAGGDDDPTATPAFLARADGQRLFYPGRVNGLIGESESGKTWVALLAVQQALADAQQVEFLDFEDTAVGVIGRLRALGVPDEQLTRFSYIAPDEALHAAAAADLTETLRADRPALIILDGFNAAMTLLGLELESNTDATKFAQQLLKPLAATGAAVVTVDHLPKNKEQRGKGGIGAQAKRAMASGCLITVEVLTSPAPGQTGKLHLTVDKDRPGAVRGASAGARNVGTAIIASDPGTGDLTITIESPERLVNARGEFRPTTLMERVTAFLATTPGGASGKAVEDGVRGNAAGIRAAMSCLVDEGFVERATGPRGAIIHQLVRPFTAETDALDEVAGPELHEQAQLRGGLLIDPHTGELLDDDGGLS